MLPKEKSIKGIKSTTSIKGKKTSGFTLIELLVVIALIGILTALGLANFMTSQAKGRDAKRKSSLKQIQNALETYYNDYGAYPAVGGAGQIVGCPTTSTTTCDWGSGVFTDGKSIYLNPVPSDPKSNNLQYCFNSNGVGYQIFTKLENRFDPDKFTAAITCAGNAYDFGVSSTNTTATGALP